MRLFANIRLAENGKIHYRRFSWLTLCGKTIHEDAPIQYVAVEETNASATCTKCLESVHYESHVAMRETKNYGIIVAKGDISTGRLQESAEHPHLLDVAVYVPPFTAPIVRFQTHQFSIDQAIDLGGLCAYHWYHTLELLEEIMEAQP
jgi:hypothetical protein